MNVLIRSSQQARRDRTDFYAGGNMFVYYSRNHAMNRDFGGPDFFVTLEVDSSRERKAWIVWEEDGRYPDVIVELLSPSSDRLATRQRVSDFDRIPQFREENQSLKRHNRPLVKFFCFLPYSPARTGHRLSKSLRTQKLPIL